jgi:hypothetical protein
VHPNSTAYINFIGATKLLHPDFGTFWNGAPIGIPYVVVPGDQPLVPVSFLYVDESEAGPYPIPPNPPNEGGSDSTGDRHILMLGLERCQLHELYYAWPPGSSGDPYPDRWCAGSGAIFDLHSNALRPDDWTSADAAGLPILPGLVRIRRSRRTGRDPSRAAVHGARDTVGIHSSGDALRVVERGSGAAADGAALAHEGVVQLLGIQPRGAGHLYRAQEVRDVRRRQWLGLVYVSGAHDPRRDDDRLGDLKKIPGSAFEAVYTGDILR